MQRLTLPAAMLIAALAACKPEPEGPPRIEGSGEKQVAQRKEAIACALSGEGDFKTACKVERALAGETLFLIVRHPDGAFRRFEVLKNGKGLAAADGADEARVSLAGEHLEVAIGLDRYRFPARQMEHVRKP